MRRISSIVLVVALISSVADGGDYVRIGVDRIPAGATDFDVTFYVERTCPEPECIYGISNGFIMNATGDVTWDFQGEFTAHQDFWWQGGLLFTNLVTGTDLTSGGFLVGGSNGPPSCDFPTMPDQRYFTMTLDVGSGVGEIHIDSGFVGTGGAWKWSGLTCGQGGAPDRPLFLAKDSSNAVHPIPITIFEPICGDANFDGIVDIDDVSPLIFYLFLECQGPNPAWVGDVDCSGAIDIDDIVYVVSFIFLLGPPPCDIDSDGVPDC